MRFMAIGVLNSGVKNQVVERLVRFMPVGVLNFGVENTNGLKSWLVSWRLVC
jgi:putative flippase GtrA